MEPEYLGIDLHKAFFQVCAVGATGERRWEQRWPTTPTGIAGLLTRCGPQSRLAVEASSPTWAFVDQVVAQVGVVHVVDTRKTRIKAGYAAKTDRLDAQRLADALRRDSVVGIYYPPPAIRDLRELCRYRCHLARLQASLKQRIQALLLRHGIVRAGAPLGAARHRVVGRGTAGGLGRGESHRLAARAGGCARPTGAGARHDAPARDDRRGRAGPRHPPRLWAGLQRDVARGDWHHHPLSRWAASGQLRRFSPTGGAECGAPLDRADHQSGVALVTLGPD